MYSGAVLSPSRIIWSYAVLIPEIFFFSSVKYYINLDCWSSFDIIHQHMNPIVCEKSLQENKNLKHIWVLFYYYLYYINVVQTKYTLFGWMLKLSSQPADSERSKIYCWRKKMTLIKIMTMIIICSNESFLKM